MYLFSISAEERIFSGSYHLLFIFYVLIICGNPWLLLVQPATLTVKFTHQDVGGESLVQ